MKKTLLGIVQDILSDLDIDEVNSIDDTIQSTQVASIVRNVYFLMIANRNWPHLNKLFKLDSTGDPSKPTHLKLPELVKEVEVMRYKASDGTYVDLKYRTPDEFLSIVSKRNPSSSSVSTVVDYGGAELYILNNIQPSFYTAFDDTNVVFDAYDSTIEATLQASKTQVLGYVNPTWEHVDSFIPNLPVEAFPALQEEAKSTASLNLKQMPDQKAEANSVKQQRWLSRKAWRVAGGVTYQDFGRKGRK